MNNHKLLEQITEYYVKQYNAVVTFNSNSAKTIVIGEMTFRLQQVFDNVVVIHYRSLQHTVNDLKSVVDSPFSFLTQKEDEIVGTIRAVRLADQVAKVMNWTSDPERVYHSPLIYYLDKDGNNHCIHITSNGTIIIGSEMISNIEAFVVKKIND